MKSCKNAFLKDSIYAFNIKTIKKKCYNEYYSRNIKIYIIQNKSTNELDVKQATISFHRKQIFVRKLDSPPVWSCRSLQLLPACFQPYSLVFIGDTLRLFDFVRVEIQLLFGHKSNRFTSNACLICYFNHLLLKILGYSFRNQLSRSVQYFFYLFPVSLLHGQAH